MQVAAAARAGLALDVDHLLDPLQVRGQRAPVALTRAWLLRLGSYRVQPGLHTPHGRVDLLKREQQLVGIQLLGTRPEAVPLERCDDRAQARQLRLGVSAGALQYGDPLVAIDQHGAERLRVGGQVGLEEHEHIESGSAHSVNRLFAVPERVVRHALAASRVPPARRPAARR